MGTIQNDTLSLQQILWSLVVVASLVAGQACVRMFLLLSLVRLFLRMEWSFPSVGGVHKNCGQRLWSLVRCDSEDGLKGL